MAHKRSILNAFAILLMASACGESGDTAERTVQAESLNDNHAAPAEDEIIIEPHDVAADALLAAYATSKSGFGVETAKITYETAGETQGSYTLFLENFGEQAASIEEADQDKGRPQRTRYWDGRFSYEHTENDETVTVSSIRFANLEPSVILQASPTQLLAQGYANAGWREVAGVQCQMWRSEMVGNEVCVWKGVEIIARLGKQQNGDYRLARKATSIDEDAGIPQEVKTIAAQALPDR